MGGISPKARRALQLEDELTERLAAALRADAAFRSAYERVVLAPLASGEAPGIVDVSTQVSYQGQGSRPDMQLELQDGRRVVCEHKIKASEKVSEAVEGEPSSQLERYLALPGVDAVAYVRATLNWPGEPVLANPRYLRPADAPHFLWRDLYEALASGTEPATVRLRDDFASDGYTPAVAHVGRAAGQACLENFGKLWDATWRALSARWRSEYGTASTLFLMPREPSAVEWIKTNPKRGDGTILWSRVRLWESRGAEDEAAVRDRLASVLPVLEAKTTMRSGFDQGRRVFDLEASLFGVLVGESEADGQQARLLGHLRPIADALESLAKPGETVVLP